MLISAFALLGLHIPHHTPRTPTLADHGFPDFVRLALTDLSLGVPFFSRLTNTFLIQMVPDFVAFALAQFGLSVPKFIGRTLT